tara:strand:- start:456 stop:965 length:510 start_codon:yes stop_codon:yes gene_type:complete
MFRKRGKKGSLNLSMNAIVVLILAITMLGLGLTFMRGLFKQATERVTEAVSAQELVNPPTVDSPLTAAPGDLTMRTKDVGKIIVAYLSQYSGVDECTLTISATPAGIDVVTIAANNQAVFMQQDQINTWTVALTSIDGSTTGTGIYTATMACSTSSTSYNKDIVITTTS